MSIAPSLAAAKVFPNHRAMIATIADLLKAGQIEAYSIHRNGPGVSAGVRIGDDRWGYLA